MTVRVAVSRGAKDASRRILDEVWNNDDHGRLPELAADGSVWDDVDAYAGSHAPSSLPDIVDAYKAVVPDLSFRVLEQVREASRVITCWRAEGVHAGRAARVMPTLRRVTLHGTLAATASRRGTNTCVRGTWDVRGFVAQVGVAESEFVRLLCPADDEVKLRSSDAASGMPVLLFPTMSLPGWVTWKRTIAGLQATRPVISYQLLANRWAFQQRQVPTGYTLKAENRALLTALDRAGWQEPFDLVGHSAGGLLALDYALDHPTRVRSLTLIEPGLTWLVAATGGIDAELRRHLDWRTASYTGRMTAARYAAFLRATYLEKGYEPTASPRWPMLRAYMHNMRFRQSLLQHTDDPDRLRRLHCPVLVIQGRDTDPLHRAVTVALRRLLPAIEVVEMPGGHVPHYGSGAEPFLAILNRFHAGAGRLVGVV